MSQVWVYDFAEGSREMRELLGSKSANVAEMTRVLRPQRVPAGFAITTEACVAYMREGRTLPERMAEQVDEALERLQSTPVSGAARARTRCWSPCAPAHIKRARGGEHDTELDVSAACPDRDLQGAL